jgi:hypothetical protein
MTTVERNFRILVIDHERVVLVEGKRPLEELHGRRRKAALDMLGIVDPRPEPKPQRELPAMEEKPPPAPLANGPLEYGSGEEKPRKYNKHGNYQRAMKPPLTGSSAVVLAKLATYSMPQPSSEIGKDLYPMPPGTVGARLSNLCEGGYAEKKLVAQPRGRKIMNYRITERGEEFLTRPEGGAA